MPFEHNSVVTGGENGILTPNSPASAEKKD